MTPKYFYVEDDTGALIAANGTALGALLLNVSEVLSSMKFALPTFPMWLYLAGLVFAFASKGIVQAINGDIRQREKLQYARDFVIDARESSQQDPELDSQLQDMWAAMEKQHARLLKPNHGPLLDRVRALSFFASALCFLVGTSTLIVLAGQLSPVD